MDSPLVLIVHLRARSGLAAALGASLSALVAPTRQEPGCLAYALHRAADDPALFMLHEVWRSRADLDEHFGQPYLRAFLAQQENLLEAPFEIRSYLAFTDRADVVAGEPSASGKAQRNEERL